MIKIHIKFHYAIIKGENSFKKVLMVDRKGTFSFGDKRQKKFKVE